LELEESRQMVFGTGHLPSIPIEGKWQHRQFPHLEEGIYEDGAFKTGRNLNGDQTDWWPDFAWEAEVQRVSLATRLPPESPQLRS
jgi:hypothetical protein